MKIFDRFDYLPASMLCKRPFVFGCFFEDFIKRIDGFKIWYEQNREKHANICALFMFGYHYETPPRMDYAAERIAEIKNKFPTLKFYFLCNSEIERDNFAAIGQKAVFCNQNAFLNENRYFITGAKKIYNAVYLARITPIKRHALALDIPKLLLIGDYFEREKVYAEGVLNGRRSDTVWIRRVRGIFMFLYLNRAKVGLCLSPEEGAMYACAEYGLCGLPVLTCKCLGGREFSLSPKYTLVTPTSEPSEKEIAEYAAALAEKNYNPRDVRRATIEVLKEHRGRYEALIREIFEECGEGTEADFKMFANFPHKFGVRCRITPLFEMFRTLKIRKQRGR